MALLDALSGISVAEHVLAQTLAAASQWQADVGADDADGALEHVYFHALPPPDDRHTFKVHEYEALRPYAIIATHPTDGGFSWDRIASEAWEQSGTLILDLEYNVHPDLAGDNQALFRNFYNQIGSIVQPNDAVQTGYVGLLDLAHSPDYLAINRVRLDFAGRSNELAEETEGDFLFARLIVSWGVGQQ